MKNMVQVMINLMNLEKEQMTKEELNNEVITAFEDFEINGVSEVITSEQSNGNWQVYINTADAPIITIELEEVENNEVIVEEITTADAELKKQLKAVEELYEDLYRPLEYAVNDFEDDTLTFNEIKGVEVAWYLAENKEGLVIIDTLEFLDGESEEYEEMTVWE